MTGTVGIVGLGIMGGAIARNLVAAGWRAIGFDIDPARCAELEADGVEIAEIRGRRRGPCSEPHHELAEPAGCARRRAGDRRRRRKAPGRRSRRARLRSRTSSRFEAILREAGHVALDCPLSGTGAQAKTRDLVVYASGDSAGDRKRTGRSSPASRAKRTTSARSATARA